MNWEKFVQDIHNDAAVESINGVPAALPNAEVISFVHPTIQLMDCPRRASYIHIKNLVNTYGIDVVTEAMEVVTDEIK